MLDLGCGFGQDLRKTRLRWRCMRADIRAGQLDPAADTHVVEDKVHIIHAAAFFQVFCG